MRATQPDQVKLRAVECTANIATAQSGRDNWPPEQAELLRKLRVDQRLSFGAISKLIPGKSRNACIAKAHRMGLSGEVVTKSTRSKRVKPSNPAQTSANSSRSTSPWQQEPFVPLGDDLVIPPDERKTLQMLTENCCRWPFGDPQDADFHFCGKQKVTGLPYCEFHARRAFQPAVPRSRAPAEPQRAPEPILQRARELVD